MHGSSVTTRVQPVSRHAPQRDGRGAERDDLGVTGGVVLGLADVAAGADHVTGRVEDDRADGHVVGGQRGAGLGEREPHRLVPESVELMQR